MLSILCLCSKVQAQLCQLINSVNEDEKEKMVLQINPTMLEKEITEVLT